MAVFNWNYFSFYEFDTTWLYREVVLIPILIAILWIVWMKVVRGALKDALNQTEPPMSLDEAYATAIINEALDTDDEAENENAQPEPTKSADTIADEAVIAPEEPKKGRLKWHYGINLFHPRS